MAQKFADRRFSNFTSLREAGAHPSTGDGSGGRVYKGATIIRSGLGNRRDRNFYPVSTLESAAKSGMFEGLRAYADHQNSVDEEIQPERSIRDIVGLYTNTRYVSEGKSGRVVGDLRILKSHKWLSDMVDELIEVGHADKVGISINGRGHTVPSKVRLEESGEEIVVNELKQFIDLRSADVVTEAGAGGGFQQILESARGAAKERHAMDRKQIAKELAEAAEAGDLAKVEELTAKLRECSDMPKGMKKKAKKMAEADEAQADGEAVEEAFEKAKADEDVTDKDTEDDAADEADEADDAADEADDAADEADEADDAADEADVDPLDAAVEEAVAGTEGVADEADEADCAETEAGCDEGETVEEADEADEHAMSVKSAVAKLKANALKGATQEAGKKLTKSDPSTGAGKGTALINSKKKTTKGRPLPLTEADDVKIERLQNKVAKLTNRNERLAEALRIRTSADRARKLLRESGIPQALQPELLHRLVGKSEEEMQKEIRFHKRLVETVVGAARESASLEDFSDETFEKVEGAGSRVRESYGGGSDEDENDIMSMVTDSGLPIKK